MTLGRLNIERIQIDPSQLIRDFQVRLYLQFADIVENTDCGRSVVEMLSGDSRVAALEGKMVSRGSGADMFAINTLAMWFLWCANEHGLEDARAYMDSWLDSERVWALKSLWVLGVELDEAVVLSNGCTIRPISQMPDSGDKERFLQARLGPGAVEAPAPASAIVKPWRVAKVWAEDPALDSGSEQELQTASQQLFEIALLLNALRGVSCVPYYSADYVDPTTPLGPFGGSGGGVYVHDVTGRGSTRVPSESADTIESLLASYHQRDYGERRRLQRILSRLSQAKRRRQIEDKMLDLGIALEMLLLDNNDYREQLSLTFRLRGGWLLGESARDRVEKYRQFRDIYTYRSQVAHGGVLCGGDVRKIESVHQSFPQYQSLAEDVVQKLMRDGKPDWGELILGAT
jgi:hypothetical protein